MKQVISGLDMMKVIPGVKFVKSSQIALELMVPVFAITAKLKSLQTKGLVQRNRLGEWRLSAEGQIARNAGKEVKFGSVSGAAPPEPVSDKGVRVVKFALIADGWRTEWRFDVEFLLDPDGRRYQRANSGQKADLIHHSRTLGIPSSRWRLVSDKTAKSLLVHPA